MADIKEELAELLPENTTLPRQGIGINVERLFKLRGRKMLVWTLVPAIVVPLVIVLLVPREFVASATVLFPSRVPSIMEGQENRIGGEVYENYVNTQVNIITSYEIAKRAMENEELKALPAVAEHAEPIQFLMQRVEAEFDRQTEMVGVTFRHKDQQTALVALRSIIDAYMAYVHEQELESGAVRRETLLKTEADLEANLEKLRQAIAEARKTSGLPVGEVPGLEPTETESLRISLTQAQNDLVRAQNDRRQAEKQIERAQDYISRHEQNPLQPIYAMGVEQSILLDPNVSLLLEQLAQVQQEYAVIKDRYQEGRGEILAKEGELSALEGRVEQAKSRARGDALRSLLAQYEYDVTVYETNVEDAKERVAQFEGLLAANREENIEASRGQGQIVELERQYDDTRTYLRDIRDQLITQQMEQNAPARASVLGEPTVENEPDSTRRVKYILVALLASVFLGLLRGIAEELRDQTIRSAQDVGYVTELPVLAAVPHLSEDRLPSTAAPATVTDDFPASMTSDEYRRAASRLLYGLPGGGRVRTCLVASPARGDGKTTLACNLAIVLAQSDRRVLLVDVDSRNPGVEKSFGLRPGSGLAEMLSGEQLSHDPDRQTSFENLFVLGPGLRSKDLLERLSSRDMADFLSGAEELFDIVIVDTPATLLMSEARLLAPIVDGVIVVVGSGVSSFGMLRRGLNVLSESGGRILGIVLNVLRQSPGGYLRRNLDQYYAQAHGEHKADSTHSASVRTRRTAEPSIILLDEEDEGRPSRDKA